jgi:hypothetical protein
VKTFTINGQKVAIADDVDTRSITTYGHMSLFARLAAITNMHNPPGPKKGKGGGKR